MYLSFNLYILSEMKINHLVKDQGKNFMEYRTKD